METIELEKRERLEAATFLLASTDTTKCQKVQSYCVLGTFQFNLENYDEAIEYLKNGISTYLEENTNILNGDFLNILYHTFSSLHNNENDEGEKQFFNHFFDQIEALVRNNKKKKLSQKNEYFFLACIYEAFLTYKLAKLDESSTEYLIQIIWPFFIVMSYTSNLVAKKYYISTLILKTISNFTQHYYIYF